MKTKDGFTQLTIQEFETYIKQIKVARTILYIQQHHTYIPSYQNCISKTNFEVQKGMEDYHLSNGFDYIAQHFSTFPDGTILTGRSLEKTPAGIKGFNLNAICIENVGNFDAGKDIMTAEQKSTIVKMTAILANKFSIPNTTDRIVYHHWFNLTTGARNNGSGNNKSCPGTNFFGGNKVNHCQNNFLPLVQAEINKLTQSVAVPVNHYRIVTADTLNVRNAPIGTAPKTPDRDPITFGSVLRVYEENNGWLKISSSSQHWVSGRFTQQVTRATVNADTLNVRSDAGANFDKVGSLLKGIEVFITEQSGDWSKISLEMRWVKTSYLDIE
jgi:hypothetical protein